MTFPRNEAKQASLTTRQMWTGGPLRRQSKPASHKDQYVCSKCKSPVVGLHRIRDSYWLCSGCKAADRK